jgi:E3 ubiquitin-protein ligase ZNF598
MKSLNISDTNEQSVKKGKEVEEGASEEEDDGQICFICANPVRHWAVAPCNHRTCHVCSLRMRALYKNKGCAHCRTASDFVIFTDDAEKKYQDYEEKDFIQSDSNLGIKYESSNIFDETVFYLRYNCPDKECDVQCFGWPTLHRHVRTVHGKVMCDLCTRNKKVFTHEHELFTQAELRKHERKGDDQPGAVDQSGFNGHPECGFCRQRFYDDDALYSHCREKHERCHICDRRNDGKKHQYYLNYDALEVHFRQDHFLCPDEGCLEKKFVVFESQMDLKAHQLESHPHGLSKDAKRDARRVDMSEFSYRPTEDPGRRGGRGRVRGRDPNVESQPTSSTRPLRRDELAYHRQMEIQNAQSASVSTTHVTDYRHSQPTSDTFAARGPPRSQGPNTVTAVGPTEAFASSRGPNPSSNAPTAPQPQAQPDSSLTPQEQARRLRHQAVINRASTLLKGDETKVDEFRAKISSFRIGAISASDLIDAFFSLFDTSSTELGKLVKELAEIYEIPGKRDALLTAWNDWKAINEDYPSLPGSSGLQASQTAGTTRSAGSKVLKLKSSTSARQQGNWSSTTGFPSLPSTVGQSSRSKTTGPTPWATSASSSARPSPIPSRPGSAAPQPQKPSVSEDAFPALPAAAKPTTTLFTPGGSGWGVAIRRPNGTSTMQNAWGTSATTAAASDTQPAEAEAASGAKKKGKKNQKQTLIHFG